MPPDEYPPDDPREWLRMASEDLALAKLTVAGVGFPPLCFHAQQAAEKAIKGVLLAREVPFPYTHDIGRLLDLADTAARPVHDDLKAARHLSDYAVLTRYPLV